MAIGTDTGTEMEGGLEETGTTGVIDPGRATDQLAMVVPHATRLIPGAGETLTTEMRGTGATGRLGIETVWEPAAQNCTWS